MFQQRLRGIHPQQGMSGWGREASESACGMCVHVRVCDMSPVSVSSWLCRVSRGSWLSCYLISMFQDVEGAVVVVGVSLHFVF